VDLTVLVLSPPPPDSSLEETCQALLGDCPATPALALVRPDDAPAVRLAARHGARAIFDTLTTVETLRTVVGGLGSAAPAVQPSLVHHLVEDGSAGGGTGGGLRPRELAALQLLAQGYTSKQIGAALGATPKAVDLLVERAAQRLGASHRTQAVAIAARLGLLTTT
jgi:DNA-binding NarL/FixJ family response regulator